MSGDDALTIEVAQFKPVNNTGPSVSYHRRKAFHNGVLERYAVRHRLPEPAPAPDAMPTPQPLIIRVPAGIQVEAIQGSPVGEIALAT